MNIKLLLFSVALVVGGTNLAIADDEVKGAPHSAEATVSYSDVTFGWKAPTAAHTLTWSIDYAYNGDDGQPIEGHQYATIYAANRFDANDLAGVVGEQVYGIQYYEYRPVLSTSICIFEDGVLVREKACSMANYQKDTYKEGIFDEPYTIPAGKEVIFAVKYEHGLNMQLVATKDNLKNHSGKGDVYSYDGVNWGVSGNGNYLVTALLVNNNNVEPDGYSLYRDNEKVATTDASTLSYTLEGETDGTHSYCVAACYGADEVKGASLEVETRSAQTYFPAATVVGGTVDGFDLSFNWVAPQIGDNQLTWGTDIFSQNIGGTASSNTKVWVKNEFDSNDLLAYVGRTLNSVSIYLKENVILSGSKLVIFKDGVVDYAQDLTSTQISGIAADAWTTISLNTPYTIESGHTYAYGFYFLHTPKMHPIGVSNCPSLTKGNQFSTSSPSSNFANSKPSWKTLASGNIPGCWMMYATMSEAAGNNYTLAGYDIYTEGQKVAEGLTDTEYSFSVDKPGQYTYGVVAVGTDGRKSVEKRINFTVTLPSSYTAPMVDTKSFDADTKTVKLSWSSDNTELKLHGEAAYYTGFAEELTMKWGAKFTAQMLSAHAGKQIKKIKFAIGEKFGNFKIGVYNAQGVALSEEDIMADEIEALTYYNLNLTTPVTITGEEDLYIAYSGTVPANCNALLIDAGPLNEGGAMINLGANWMKLGTVAPDCNNYNLVISATAAPADTPAPRMIPAGGLNAPVIELKNGVIEKVFGVDAATELPMRHIKTNAPTVVSYNVYRNGQKIASTTQTNFSEVLENYGFFTYGVSSVYSDGLESAPSAGFVVHHMTPQLIDAPKNLTASAETSAGDLTLTWEPAKELYGFAVDDNVRMALGMTGTGTREGYALVRMPASTAENNIGRKIEKIRFDITAIRSIQTLSVVCFVGENLVYEQEVNVGSLIEGVNEVALDEPWLISDALEYGFGYHMTYPNGYKPMVTDEGPAVRGYGDVITGSATPGYFYSLADKYNVDRNWRVWAVLSNVETSSTAMGPNRVVRTDYPVAYNVYCNAEKVAENVHGLSCSLTDALSGSYTVRAVVGNRESEDSNVVDYINTGIENLKVDSENTMIYNLSGQRVNAVSNGMYIINGEIVNLK